MFFFRLRGMRRWLQLLEIIIVTVLLAAGVVSCAVTLSNRIVGS